MREFKSRFDTCWNLNSVQSMIKSVSPWPVLTKISSIFFSKKPSFRLKVNTSEDCLKENYPTKKYALNCAFSYFKHKCHQTLMERMSTDCKNRKDQDRWWHHSNAAHTILNCSTDIPHKHLNVFGFLMTLEYFNCSCCSLFIAIFSSSFCLVLFLWVAQCCAF